MNLVNFKSRRPATMFKVDSAVLQQLKLLLAFRVRYAKKKDRHQPTGEESGATGKRQLGGCPQWMPPNEFHPW
jgi:hypothetical protein